MSASRRESVGVAPARRAAELNTHHPDHTGGDGVFRGVARRVVAHGMADQHMRRAPGGPPQQPPPQQNAPEPLYLDTTRNWARLLEQVVNAHASDTIYIVGHANAGLPVTGSSADPLQFRDYLAGVLTFVERQAAAGRSREEVLAMRAPLAGFEAWGAFPQASARDPLTAACEEVTTGS
jgi:hypothetical protein